MIKAIYKITNKLNGKMYIGQSVHPSKRWWEHCRRAITKYDSYPLHCALRKYGKENFEFEIIEHTDDYDRREQELINQFNTKVPNGYNVVDGGHSPIMLGAENPRNTISDTTLYCIVESLSEGVLSDRQIARMFGTTDKIVSDINNGRSHVIEGISYPIRIKRGRQILSENDENSIKNLLRNSTCSYAEIAQQFKTTKINISQINCGRSFRRDGTKYPIRVIPAKINQYK